jgi:hypothetical protein
VISSGATVREAHFRGSCHGRVLTGFVNTTPSGEIYRGQVTSHHFVAVQSGCKPRRVIAPQCQSFDPLPDHGGATDTPAARGGAFPSGSSGGFALGSKLLVFSLVESAGPHDCRASARRMVTLKPIQPCQLRRRIHSNSKRRTRDVLEPPELGSRAYKVFKNAMSSCLFSGVSCNPNSCPLMGPGPR